jgi:hypothetical protein
MIDLPRPLPLATNAEARQIPSISQPHHDALA